MNVKRLTYTEERLKAIREAFGPFVNAPIFTTFRPDKSPTHPAGHPGVTFDEALASFRSNKALSGVGVHMGPLPNAPGKVLFGVDYDGIDKGPLPEGFPETETYKERSPSGGDRFHILGFYEGEPFKGAKVGAVEVYPTRRYLTLTGDRISGLEIRLTDPLQYYRSIGVADPEPYASDDASAPGARGVKIAEDDLNDRERGFLDVVRGTNNKDKSSRDFAVCATLVERGATNEEIGRVVCAGFWRPKLQREDYLAGTIAEARKRSQEVSPADPNPESVKAYAEVINAAGPTPESVKAFRDNSRTIGEGDEPKIIPVIYNLESMLDEAVFIKEGSQVALLSDPRIAWSFSDFENATAASTVKPKGKGRPGSVAKAWLRDPQRMTVETRTFHAGATTFCQSPDDLRAINTWREPPRIPPPADWRKLVVPFLAHVAYLIPERTAAALFLDWLAHIEQRPSELPHWHFLMFTRTQGIGRNLLSAMLARVWAGVTALDVDLAAMLDGGFNGRISRKILVVVNEIQEGGGGGAITHRRAEQVKRLLTDSQRHINPKYGREYVEFNSARWLIFSNHENALPLDPKDRRVYVVENPTDAKDATYYTTLYRLVGDPKFIASIREWLRVRDLARFNVGMLAAMTEAKRRVIEASMSEEDVAMREVVKDYPADCITTDDLARILFSPQSSPGDRSALRYIAGRADARKYPKKVRLIKGGRQRNVWVLRNHATWMAKTPEEIAAHINKHRPDDEDRM